jgi:hypothetical protein
MPICLCGCGQEIKEGRKYVRGHNSLGRKPTEGTRQKMSEAAKGKIRSEETKQKLSIAVNERLKNPEYREGISIRSKQQWANPEYRERQIEAHKGHPGPMVGKKHSAATCEKLRTSHLGLPSGARGHVHSEEARKKMSKSHTGVPLTEQCKKNLSKVRLLMWENRTKEDRKQLIKKVMDGVNKGHRRKPNKPESIILQLLNNLYPNQWKYTGDFSLIIDGKNPDFANCNGQKKIIELFGDYWHRGENPQDRMDIFSPFGYQTLVIWERELKDIPKVVEKIKIFHEDLVQCE